MTIEAWALSLMLAWAPPERGAPWPELRGESRAETIGRYVELADATIKIVDRNGPLAPSTNARRSVAVLLSIAYHETGFYNRVTTTAGTDRKRSDAGRSWCAGQVLIGRGPTRLPEHYRELVPERWTGRELEADPEKCMEVVYRFVRQSMTKCGGAEPLAAYTGEPCKRAPKARQRMARAMAAKL